MKPFALLSAAFVVTHVSVASAADRDPWFGRDKVLHFSASAAIAGGGYGVAAVASESRSTRIVVGASAGVAAGVGKELLDLTGYGDPSWKDLTWDGIGCVAGLGLALLVDVLVRGVHPAATSAPATALTPQGVLVRW